MPHKRTLGQRIKKYFEMPHLKRRDRNQRVAIVGVIAGLAVYLLVLRPVIALLFPPSRPRPAQPSRPPARKPGLPGQKR